MNTRDKAVTDTAIPASASAQLAAFAANLRFAAIPDHVIRKTEDLYLDWLGSALAGKGARGRKHHALCHDDGTGAIPARCWRP